MKVYQYKICDFLIIVIYSLNICGFVSRHFSFQIDFKSITPKIKFFLFPMLVTGSCSSCLSHFSLLCDENFHGHPGKFYFPSFSACLYWAYARLLRLHQVISLQRQQRKSYIYVWQHLSYEEFYKTLPASSIQVTKINKTWGNYEFSTFINKIYVRKPLAVILGLILDEGWFSPLWISVLEVKSQIPGHFPCWSHLVFNFVPFRHLRCSIMPHSIVLAVCYYFQCNIKLVFVGGY